MLVKLGVTYREVSLAELGALTSDSDQIARELAGLAEVDGSFVLATCNRFEIYLDAPEFHAAFAALAGALGARLPRLEPAVGEQAVMHVFTVAAGLDAMVVGEAEISGQLRRALDQARKAGTLTAFLDRLGREAVECAKAVATRTDLGRAGRSTAAVALDLAAGHLAPWPECSVLIIGTGAIARVAAAAIERRGCASLSVYSPSGNAESFASTHQAAIIAPADLAGTLEKVDLVVAASGHARSCFDQAATGAMASRDEPIILVDLAVPSDLPDDARDYATVVDLGDVAAASGELGAITEAGELVREATERFAASESVRRLDPAIVALRGVVGDVAGREIERMRRRFGPEVAEELSLSLHRITQTLLHQPTARAKLATMPNDQQEYLRALHMVFGIELPPTCGHNPDS